MAQEEFYAGLPKKRIIAGALFTDTAGRLLILQPSYRTSWTMPGGMVEDGESPRQACIREVREEIGIEFRPGRLLCVDYNTHSDSGLESESIKFIFDGGVLDAGAIAEIRIDQKEIIGYEFAEPESAYARLDSQIIARIRHELEARQKGTVAYLENGEIPQ